MHQVENTLGKIQLHWMTFAQKAVASSLIGLVVILVLIGFGTFQILGWFWVVLLILITLGATAGYVRYRHHLWDTSCLYITNTRIYLEINRAFGSKYALDTYFSKLRDTAYSYNSFFGKIFKFGTFFARTGNEEHAGQGIMAKWIPYPDIVREYVNYLFSLPEDKRMIATTYEEFFAGKRGLKGFSPEERLRDVKQTLLVLRGIKDVAMLTEDDKDRIWNIEEERNIGVFETLMRRYVVVVTHDASWRPAAADIVIKRGERVIFPPVPFPEVKEKDAVSSSPGMAAHQYLSSKVRIEPNDATILIGFN